MRAAAAVHAEARVTSEHRVLARAAERAYQQVDRLIAAAADQHGVRCDPVEQREALEQRPRLRLGIAVEAGV